MYPITEQAVDLLTKIRHKMENAWGPEMTGMPPSAATAAGAAPGEVGGAVNPPNDIDDMLNMYLDGVVERLMKQFEMSEDEAIDHVFSCADEMAEGGDLPTFDEDGDAQSTALWLARAQTVGFISYCLGRAAA